ncbi:mobilome CxxCx(11)CxxC protein [Xanthobacter sp. VTT E-85241]|uniref:mobilome CxxCx(11)CxxC protein n=1 Tax=Roseixanthobacter finlandensis TaxID=3119922 RepID=UPI003727F8F3
MSPEEIRAKSADNALHAEGTRHIFDERTRKLSILVRSRDFIGIAIPLVIGYVLSADFFDFLKNYQRLAITVLALLALAQLLLTLWSLISKWDEELQYCNRASRDSYALRTAWNKLAENDAENLELEYKLLSKRQDDADSHDIQKGIKPAEYAAGMRTGLILFKRKCYTCDKVPTTRTAPWRPKSPCMTCGGN